MDFKRALYYTSPVMIGKDVKLVQDRLNALGYYKCSIDESFGPRCKQAVIDFQKANGLSADGSVGPITWGVLFGTNSSNISEKIGNVKKVFIDPGHGGSDSGAIGNGLEEKDITLSMALNLGRALESKGISVNYSRKTDKYVSLESRASQANTFEADLFISLHCNSSEISSANGTECFTYANANIATKTLSRNVSNSIAKCLSLVNRGAKDANFAVLRQSNMPAILIETAFISNPNDARKLEFRQNEFVSSIVLQIIGVNI
ncbi:MAG: N-acetylmuramoyl-L-alanine amidase [Paraclostridium sp.]